MVKKANISKEAILEMWQTYQREKTLVARNRLVMHWLYLVATHATKLVTKLPECVDASDLAAVGVFGLIGAIEDFNLDYDVKFEVYSFRRIRGAMLDSIREGDWAPRLVRTRHRKVKDFCEEYFHKHGFQPSEAEIMAGVALDKYGPKINISAPIEVKSLFAHVAISEAGRVIFDLDFIASNTPVPGEELNRKNIRDTIFKGLDRAEKSIMTLYYYHDMTMREIGDSLDLSESRVSQIHSSILGRLKSKDPAQLMSLLGCDRQVGAAA